MKKTLAIFLSVLFVCAAIRPTEAETFVPITASTRAQVIQVIDGDAMRVRLTDTGESALIRLLGVDATGRDDAFNYLDSRLTGKYVSITLDPAVNSYDGRWNYVYVTYQRSLINIEIVRRGFAKVSTEHSSFGNSRELAYAQERARGEELGRWASDNLGSQMTYVGSGVNINTATASQIRNTFTGISSTVANNIVKYREHNPFDNPREIKFVEGFTKTMFDNNRQSMTVSTNINTASREELRTLSGVTSAMAEEIIDARNFTRISTLLSRDILPRSVYNANSPFMSVENRTTISAAVPDKVVNINTASSSQLIAAGLTTKQADAVVEYRRRYSYKTLEELNAVPGVSLNISRLSDNLNIMTDINNASLDEIKSLLGESATNSVANRINNNKPYNSVDKLSDYVGESVYNSFKAFVYVKKSSEDRVNLNTASEYELKEIGFSELQTASIIMSRPIAHPGRLPINPSALDRNVVLYTNVNEAERWELQSLSSRINEDFISELIYYRNSQPFGSFSELEEFFIDQRMQGLYNELRSYLVLR